MRFVYDGPAGEWNMVPAGEMTQVQPGGGLPLWMVVGGSWLGGLSLGLAVGSYFELRRKR
jgi:hypothetical protein